MQKTDGGQEKQDGEEKISVWPTQDSIALVALVRVFHHFFPITVPI